MTTEKMRVDLRLPRELVEAVDHVAGTVGLKRNAFFAIASAQLAAQMSGVLVTGAKRRHLFEIFEEQVTEMLLKARRVL